LPGTVIAARRFVGWRKLSETIGALADAGYQVRSLASWPTGQALFEYNYLLTFTGVGSLRDVQSALANSAARLIGALAT
ncbi:MAG TPA: hypothetical protein VKU60_17350, partial [Chloroflexota bacterium]|nr:hypothetical protein [Chloroflexota bacterium]